MSDSDEKSCLLDRDAFQKAAGQRRFKDVSIPEFGKFRLRSLFDSEVPDEKGVTSWIIACVVDKEGDQVFGDIDKEWLDKLDFAIAKKIKEEIVDHCMIGPYAPMDEELKKTSSTT